MARRCGAKSAVVMHVYYTEGMRRGMSDFSRWPKLLTFPHKDSDREFGQTCSSKMLEGWLLEESK